VAGRFRGTMAERSRTRQNGPAIATAVRSVSPLSEASEKLDETEIAALVAIQ
jgi:hypothetical protein